MTAHKKQLFVTTALPYANGKFHIGHIMEYIQADIWVRFQRMQGHAVNFVGADDAHGAPIMIAAEKAGQTAQQFVADIAAGRKQYLDGFHIAFDNWSSTDSPENHELARQIYRDLRDRPEGSLIETKTVEQFFDAEKNMFLPDRFIKGECPNCHTKDQYGDNCESCGAVYAPTELINPYSALSGAKPVLRSSEHFFFKLSDPDCVKFLQAWTQDPDESGKPPAMLHFSGRKTPNNIFVHGFLTVNNGEKMSKSRGTGLDPLKYLDLGMNPEWLRYYLATKLNARNEDIDFNAADFLARVNSDLIGKYVNIASRAAGFIAKRFAGKLGPIVSNDGKNLLGQLIYQRSEIQHLYDKREFAKALREVMALTDQVNAYVDANKPWELAKQADQHERLHEVCSTCMEAFRLLTLYFKPVLPALAKEVEEFLKIKPQQWIDTHTVLQAGHLIGDYKHLMQRVDVKQLDALFEPPAQAESAQPAIETVASGQPGMRVR